MPSHSAAVACTAGEGLIVGCESTALEQIFQQYVQEQGVQAILLQKYTSLIKAHKGMKATVRRAYEAMRSIHSIGSSRSRLLKRKKNEGKMEGERAGKEVEEVEGEDEEGMRGLQAMVNEYMGMERRRAMLRNAITQSRRRATILANRHRALAGTDIRATIRQGGHGGDLSGLKLAYSARPAVAVAAEADGAPP